jgi:hypothetical protein
MVEHKLIEFIQILSSFDSANSAQHYHQYLVKQTPNKTSKRRRTTSLASLLAPTSTRSRTQAGFPFTAARMSAVDPSCILQLNIGPIDKKEYIQVMKAKTNCTMKKTHKILKKFQRHAGTVIFLINSRRRIAGKQNYKCFEAKKM